MYMYGGIGIMGMYNKRYMHDMLDTSQKIAFISLKLLIQVTNHAFVFAFCDSRFCALSTLTTS